MRELVTAHSLLAAMAEGRRLQGLSLGSGLDARSAFAGRLQMGCVALMGHSYGGASVAGLTAEDGRFACGIALDPWWCASRHSCPEAARGHLMHTQIPWSLSVQVTDLQLASWLLQGPMVRSWSIELAHALAGTSYCWAGVCTCVGTGQPAPLLGKSSGTDGSELRAQGRSAAWPGRAGGLGDVLAAAGAWQPDLEHA